MNGLLDTHGYNSHTPEDEKTSCKKLHVEYVDSAGRLSLRLIEAGGKRPSDGCMERYNWILRETKSGNTESGFTERSITRLDMCCQ